jgi:hypothetical protein
VRPGSVHLAVRASEGAPAPRDQRLRRGLDIRKRRQHDLRRSATFISLCLGDGASKDILRWITHAPEGDVVDDYTTLVWHPLCREVSKLDLRLLRGKVRRVCWRRTEDARRGSRELRRRTGERREFPGVVEDADVVTDLANMDLPGGRDLSLSGARRKNRCVFQPIAIADSTAS